LLEAVLVAKATEERGRRLRRQRRRRRRRRRRLQRRTERRRERRRQRRRQRTAGVSTGGNAGSARTAAAAASASSTRGRRRDRCKHCGSSGLCEHGRGCAARARSPPRHSLLWLVSFFSNAPGEEPGRDSNGGPHLAGEVANSRRARRRREGRSRSERGAPLHETVERVRARVVSQVVVASARSAPPRQQLAGNAYACPHLAREVFLAQPDLAAPAPRELGCRLRLGHGPCPGWSRRG
jgi:hypothetical protein